MKTGSNKSFGLLIAAVLFLIAAFNYWHDGSAYRYFLAAALLFTVIALVMPRLFAPLTRLWFKVGYYLHFVAGPLVLGLAYVLAIMPTALAIRLFGKDLLSLKLDNSASSYWVKRATPLTPAESLKDQF